ncbi:unnamed protein product [Sympodiomycopsis kandeliae]
MPHKRPKQSTRLSKRQEIGQDNAPSSKAKRDTYFGSMPKAAMRILNAGKVQEEYNARRREALANGQPWGPDQHRLTAAQKGKGKASSSSEGNQDESASVNNPANLKIRPGEKLGDFNRRVEQAMASHVAASARSANRKLRKQRREAREKDRLAEERKAKEGESSARKSKNKSDDGPSEPTSKDLKRAREEYENRTPSTSTPLDFAKADQRRHINDVAQEPPRLTKAPRGEGKEALARKAKLAAAMSGADDPEEAARKILNKSSRTVTKGQMPEPIQSGGVGLKRRKDLEDERERVIKMYRKKKQAKLEGNN